MLRAISSFRIPATEIEDSMEMRDASGRAIEGVYCIRPNDAVDRVITHEVDRPNGVLVSADDSFLYVADNNNNQSDGARKLWRFNEVDGSLDISSQKLIFDWKTSRGPDGMTQDAGTHSPLTAGVNRNKLPHETRLPYPAGIFVFSPSGEWLGHLPMPRGQVTNCAFGDPDLRTLYITAGGHLWTIRAAYEGAIPMASAHSQNSRRRLIRAEVSPICSLPQVFRDSTVLFSLWATKDLPNLSFSRNLGYPIR